MPSALFRLPQSSRKWPKTLSVSRVKRRREGMMQSSRGALETVPLHVTPISEMGLREH